MKNKNMSWTYSLAILGTILLTSSCNKNECKSTIESVLVYPVSVNDYLTIDISLFYAIRN